jgi:Asparagine synthase
MAANDLLTKVDRCLMAHGVEGRTPFLDPVVSDFAFRLRRKHAELRTIFELAAENAKIADWLAEGVGFELSGDFVKRSVSHAKTSGSSKEARWRGLRKTFTICDS